MRARGQEVSVFMRPTLVALCTVIIDVDCSRLSKNAPAPLPLLNLCSGKHAPVPLLSLNLHDGLCAPERLQPLLSLRGGQFGLRKHDCAEEAAELFDNMRVPAALVAGAIVPLVSFAGPRMDAADTPAAAFAKQLHFIVAITSLMNSLLSMMYATVSFNSLTENHPPAAETVAEVLQRDYELAWLGCNVCFYLGLFGLAFTCVINGYIALGPRIVLPTACLLGATVLLMISLINGSVDNNGLMAQAWGFERWFGESIFALMARYVRLLIRTAWYGGLRRQGRKGVSALLVPILVLWVAFVLTTRLALLGTLQGEV